jgi:beta-glucosidase/6-phospho-beta-glucosidase/beta-galactosidase
VTENGAAYGDLVTADAAAGAGAGATAGAGTGAGTAGAGDDDLLPDDARIGYLRDHLQAVEAAAAAGVDLRGYFHRGLTDGWEGSEGFTRHLGLVGLTATGERRPRASFDYFRRVIEQHHDRTNATTR